MYQLWRRIISAAMALVLFVGMTLPAGAEEFFAEESFGAAETFEEESFFEEEFFEDVDEVEEEIGEEEEELESRSILALPTEETKNAVEDWQLAPTNFTAVSQKNSTVLLTWVPAVKKLPKNVKYYIYEVDSKTGAALQIGKPLTGKKVTIKNVTGGKHTYLLRAEYVNSKTTEEKYGVFTPKVTVTVNSALWMNKPTLTAVQTDSKTIQVSWSVKEIADSYTLTITRGKGKTATTEIKTVKGTAYTDKKGQTGVPNSYQVQPVKGGALGKASAKKSCTLIGEGWKAAPVITSAVQTGVREVTLTWKSGEAAERYIITGGAKATTVLTNALTKNANGEYEYTLPVKKEGKVKLAVQPQGTDAKGKLVKGKKSGVFPVQVKVTSILGVKNVYAVAGDKNITIKWENYNPDASAFEVSVFNGKNVKKTNKVTAQAGKTEYTYVVKDLAVGDYGYYVRTIRTDGMAMHDDEPAIPTVKVVTATVAVTGVSLNKASTTLAVGMTETLTATVTPSNATNKSVIWTSSNTNVATVSNTGVVTAKAAGTAAITATTASGNKTATCTVTVVVPVTGVSLNKTSTTLAVGKTETLTATVAPGNATNKNVTWTSSNTNVATVSNTGVVTAKAAGSATITVKTADGAKTATCAVTVVVPVTGVSLNKTSTTLAVGKTETLTATVAPGNATNKNVTWTSSNTNVATVSNTGVVTAKAAGSTTITVKTADGAKTATCAVTVVVPVTGVSLNKTSTTLIIGKTETLTATVAPGNATNKNVTWTSSNTNVATVSNTGVVTAKAAGSTTITVKTADGTKTATCAVTVVVPVTGVSLNKTSLTLTAGKTEALIATVIPGSATMNYLIWSSSNANVASVNDSGVVTANAIGSATITVKTVDGAKTATCAVTVSGTSTPGTVDNAKFTSTSHSNITATNAFIEAKVSLSKNPTAVGYYLGTSQSNMVKKATENTTGLSYVIKSISYDMNKWGTTLTANTTYYYQFYMILDGKTYLSAVKSFNTPAKESSKIDTTKFTSTTVNGITYKDAYISANVSLTKNPTSVGYYLGTKQSNMVKKATENTTGLSYIIKSISYNMNNWGTILNANTTYYYQFYMILDGVEYLSEIKSFKTKEQGSTTKATASAVLAIAEQEVGYRGKKSNANLYDKGANGFGWYTKYAAEIDALRSSGKNFYNGNKNGACSFCDIFVDWCFIQAFGYDKALEMLCQPENSAGAGCLYSANYYKKAGRWGTTPKVGAQFFLPDGNGGYSHTGLVYKVEGNKVYTIEGGTSFGTFYGVVKTGAYNSDPLIAMTTNPRTTDQIAGYGYPKYDD